MSFSSYSLSAVSVNLHFHHLYLVREIIYLCSTLFSVITLSSVSVASLVSPSSNSLSTVSMTTGEGSLSLLGTDCKEACESTFLMSGDGDFVLLVCLEGDL